MEQLAKDTETNHKAEQPRVSASDFTICMKPIPKRDTIYLWNFADINGKLVKVR